jgi:hypothetical protein
MYILLGVAAMLWSIWCTRNDMFLRKKISFLLTGYLQGSLLVAVLGATAA